MNIDSIIQSKQTKTIINIASIVGAILVIVGVHTFYINNIWKPKIKVLEVNYGRPYAKVQINGSKIIELWGNDIVAIRAGWGVKVGSENEKIEIVRNGQVIEYI